jgi:hypothetical protein
MGNSALAHHEPHRQGAACPASLPCGDPDPPRPGRLPTSRAATWPQRSVVEVEADEVAPSLRWAIAKPERANGNSSGKGKAGEFNDEPDL